MTHYEIKPFAKTSKEALKFFEDIDRLWHEQGEPTPIAQSLFDKIFTEKKFKIYPYLLYADNQAEGVSWVELSTKSYGNITSHVPNERHIPGLIEQLKKKGHFNNKIMEMVSFQKTSQYKDACFKQQLMPNIRQRMCLWLNTLDYYLEEDHPFEFNPYQPEYFEWAGELSVKAHQVSQDYRHYDEMNIPKKRTQLDQLVWDGHYGKVIEEASIVVIFNEKPVGYCYMIEVKSWGYENVPWVFDICIDPAYHGQGIGKAVSKFCINNLIELNYDIMGLAVTVTNRYAVALYQKLGFQFVDTFYEFMEVEKGAGKLSNGTVKK